MRWEAMDMKEGREIREKKKISLKVFEDWGMRREREVVGTPFLDSFTIEPDVTLSNPF